MKNTIKKQKTLIEVGDVIRRKRRKSGLTQEVLADALGVTKATISKYEHGKIDLPVSQLPAISDVCNFRLSDYISAEVKAKDAVEILNKFGASTNDLNKSNILNKFSTDILDYFTKNEEKADFFIAMNDMIDATPSKNGLSEEISTIAIELCLETCKADKAKESNHLIEYLKFLQDAKREEG